MDVVTGAQGAAEAWCEFRVRAGLELSWFPVLVQGSLV